MKQITSSSAKTASSEELGLLFSRSARLMHRGHHHGGRMQPAQDQVLSILKDKELVNQKELMERLAVRSGSLSELLAKLEQQGMILRSRDEQDKRGIVVMITEKGRALVAEHEIRRKAKAEALFSCLSEEERKQLQTILRKLAASWAESSPSSCAEGHHGRAWGRGRCQGGDCGLVR